MAIRIRKSEPADLPALFEIWRTAVAATHDFVSSEDQAAISRIVHVEYLPTAELDVAVDEDDTPLAFLGMTDNVIDSLFVHADSRHSGLGRLLAELALSRSRVIQTEVNEQNSQAVGFWKHIGFRVVGRSDTDHKGKPYPLLIMERSSDTEGSP